MKGTKGTLGMLSTVGSQNPSFVYTVDKGESDPFVPFAPPLAAPAPQRWPA